MILELPTFTASSLTDLMARFALAVALGVLIGSERERSTPDTTAPGIRTFTILTLLGAVAILFSPIVLAMAVLVATIVALSPTFKRRSKHDDPPGYGATTIAAASTAPLLGALAVAFPSLAAAAAVAIVVILVSKERLHVFIRDTVTPEELSDALKFFIVSLIVLPFLPDEKIGPFNAFNPHTVGLLVTSLTGIGWVGYIAVRAFGASRGLPLAGFAGGFVSSTATTADMVRRAQDPALRRPAIAAALLSKISSLLVLMVLVAAVSQDLIAVLIYPFLAMIVALLATVGIYSRIGRPSQRVTELDEPAKPAERIHLGRAFALKPALILAGIITAASITSRGAALWFGSQAVIAVSAVTGTVTPQAPVLASADLVHQHLVTASDAMIGIVTALATNTIFKIVLTYMSAGRTMGALIAKTLLPATALMVVVAVITYRCLAV